MLTFLLITSGETTQTVQAGITPVPTATLWLLPVSRLLSDLAAVAAVGGFLVGGYLIPYRSDDRPQNIVPFVNWSVAALGTWCLALVLQGIASASEIFAIPLIRTLDPVLLKAFFTSFTSSRILLIELMLIMLMLAIVATAQSPKSLRRLCILALIAACGPAVSGHSGISGGHQLASSSLAVHLVSLLLWCGGLLVITVFAHWIGPNLNIVISRYSSLALWCYVGVGLSGLINAWIRLGTFTHLLDSTYGRILILKLGLLVILGEFGLLHRRKTMVRLARGESKTILRFVVVEVSVMFAAIASAVVLARTAFPIPSTSKVPTASELALGISIPPEPNTWLMTIGSFQPDLLWLTLSFLALGTYLQLCSRVASWPRQRIGCLVSALSLLTWGTSGGIGVYSHVLFSAHMVQHMIMVLGVPVLLYFSRPYELILEARPQGTDYEGLADWLSATESGRFWRFATQPKTVVSLTALGFWGIYFTPIFQHLMSSHWGHVVMQSYLLASGFLFVSCVLGNSLAGPATSMSQIRTLLVTEPIHIVFSLAVMFSGHLIGAESYARLHRTYRQDLLSDQRTGGVLGLIIGETIFLLLLGILLRRKRIGGYSGLERITVNHLAD